MAPTFLEFFAGGGMARAGLGPGWTCLFANDIDPRKGAAYADNWGGDHLRVGDVGALGTADLPGQADLAWASFPCQDLSLAGRGGGLSGARSGTFWAFAGLVENLARRGDAPNLIAIENVSGLLTSNGGRDFAAVAGAFADLGYRVGALVIDAARFAPQSRPRLFVVAVAGAPPPGLVSDGPTAWTSPPALLAAHATLPPDVAANWVWWSMPEPPARNLALADILEPDSAVARWHDARDTTRLISLMSPLNRSRLDAARTQGGRAVGAVYRRTRRDADGRRQQRAEVRFDGLAGCLRTPAGGSSRQTILIVEGDRVRSRLLTPRECARLMGLADDYRLPPGPTDAYHLLGDGVVAPVVRHLARHLFEPILAARGASRLAAE